MTAAVTDGRLHRGLRTRTALRTAALRLFAEQGFSATTVQEIADAADVTSRTFFRHFPVKEDVLFADEEQRVDEFAAQLSARPPGELLLTGILAAVHSLVPAFEEDRDTELARSRIVAECPSVGGRALRSLVAYEDVTAEFVRARLDADDEDLLPRVLASAVIGALRAAHGRWIATGAQGDLDQLLDRAAALFADEFGDRLRALTQ